MRKIILGFVGLIALIAVGSLIGLRMSTGLQDALFQRALEKRMANLTLPIHEGSLNVFICGSGSPMPDPDRASACTAIIAGGDIYLVDVGPGSAQVLQSSGLDMSRLKGVFFTHFHSDHIGDLGEIAMQSWAAGRQGPLAVFGPEGVEDVATGFALAYRMDEGYRVAHHGADHMAPGGLQLAAREIDLTLLKFGALEVTPIDVDHDPIRPAYGYRFDFAKRSVVVSGDTVPSNNLERIGAGADVLVHEALSRELVQVISDQLRTNGNERVSDMLADTLDYHTSPVEAAELANEMGVKLLIFTHIVPPIANPVMERIYLRGVGNVRTSGVVLGRDGMLFELPSGSDQVIGP
ncbi:MAG: MBL fold metallo-hydrolase [Alphaproteobacteria bacterium]|nr:MAG: MBL fold metallo-hydrolase [Alphaproteobacteria bacterium]